MSVIQYGYVPVIAIDGGAGTGKGTAAQTLAKILDYHLLDSGILYRAIGLAAHLGGSLTDNAAIVSITEQVSIESCDGKVFLEGKDVTVRVRSDECAVYASIVAQIGEMRMELRKRQLEMRKPPGLVADGRDMGFIFDPARRFFLTALPEVRAERRFLEFTQKKVPAKYEDILKGIIARDNSDQNNPVHKLRPHESAIIIDTSFLSREEVLGQILNNL